MKTAILKKLDVLRELVTDDRFDEVVNDALEYLLSYEQKKLESELEVTRQQLLSFEKQYDMNHREFVKQYESGELEDKKEYLEWFVLLSLEVSLENKLDLVNYVMDKETAAVV